VKPLSQQDHYEILEIPRNASLASVERAFRLARSTFADDSLALYSVVDPRDAEAIRLRVEEAHRVLSDPALRSDYDASLPPAPGEDAGIRFDVEPVRAAPAASPVPEALAGVAPGAYDGAAFRAARLRHSLDFGQIAGITKVNPRYLRYIEEEHMGGLPARVYVRGFVDAYARVVGFDPSQAVAGYMERFDRAVPVPQRRGRFLGRR